MATNKLYSALFNEALQGNISDLSAGGTAVKVALVTSGYTFNQDTHTSFNDITNEVSGTGYTAGGATLANKDLSTAARVTTFDADNVTWAESTITAAGAVVYDDTPGTATDKKLLCFIDFEGDETSEDGDFTLNWHNDGIFSVTVAD